MVKNNFEINTTITIKKSTKERFDNLGRKTESSDKLLNRIMDEIKTRV
jgi:hypothetical protein